MAESALTATRPVAELYRVGRCPDAWAWPAWEYAGEDGTFGNRYDDPRGEYRELYASSQRVGAFIETLAGFRVDVELLAAYEEITEAPEDAAGFPTILPGVVPAAWRSTRVIGEAKHDGAFADLGTSNSLAHLRTALAPRLAAYGLEDLDGGDLRRRAPRAFTQEVSRYVFEHGVSEAEEPLVGICYLSRLGDDIRNWAIFEPNDPYEADSAEIVESDPDLVAALELLSLTIAV